MIITVQLSLLITLSLSPPTFAGAAGECRTECLEMNKYKIVRVYLTEKLAHAGICRNVTSTANGTILSHVFPFVCHKKVGSWAIDQNDPEGIVEFSIRCPSVQMVTPEELESCPKRGSHWVILSSWKSTHTHN